jgi:hypothetical protein
VKRFELKSESESLRESELESESVKEIVMVME